MHLGGMDIFDSPLPGEDPRVKEAVPAGDSFQGNARCARLTCREAGHNAVREHRPWTSCVPGTFFAEPPAKLRSTQVFKTRGHGGGGLCILESSGVIHISQRRKPGFWSSHIRPHPPTPAHTCSHLPAPPHSPVPAHTCSHPLTPAQTHSHLPTPTHTHPHAHIRTPTRATLR